MKIKKKKHLEMLIQNIPGHPNPKVELEQYSTPANIASDIMWNAYSLGDIENLNIVDLACGTGIFALSSLILGAKNVLGIDIDGESLEIAKNTSCDIGINNADLENLHFYKYDVLSLNKISDLGIKGFTGEKTDTLIQNPPFGSQKFGQSGIDKKFIDFASKNSEVVYSFHMASTYDHLKDYITDLGCNVTHNFFYNFPLKKTYKFHTHESYNVNVVVFRFETF